jgi:predicted transport protein
MSDIKLFQIQTDEIREISGSSVALEKSLQSLIESNLEELLGVRFLATEYSTGPTHGGRIDTLGIDENGNPVIIEYKRATNENVISQGLFYLDWLLDHRAEFKLLVMDKPGADAARTIDWSAPRLLCIAGAFTRYDEHAVKQMSRNIELIRYRRFGNELLLLELVNATNIEVAPVPSGEVTSSDRYKTVSETLAELQGPLKDLYEELRAFLLALGDDVQEKTLKYYIAFKRIKNFACIELHPAVAYLKAYVKVEPAQTELEEGFTRDVGNIGHYGTGDLEITLRSREDLNRARDLFEKSYDSN